MKSIFIITFSLILSVAWGQAIDERKPDWSSIELNLSDKLEDSLISMIKWNYTEEMIKTHGKQILSKPKYTYHFLHLNSDNLIDAIYSGPSVYEGNSVSLFVNDGKSLNHWEGRTGTLKEVNQETPNSILTLSLIRYGCCDEKWNEHFQLIINPSKNGIDETDANYFIYDTEFPTEFSFRKQFKVINNEYHLRGQPKIINDEPESYYFEKGNIVATFETNDQGIALAEKTDETGRIWWFVLMYPKKQYLYHIQERNADNFWYGWMSSRYVNLVE